MTALNTDTNRVFETPDDTNAIPVAAAAKIFQGALVGRTAAGYGRPLKAGDVAIGFAKDPIDNTNGVDGEKTCELKSKGKASLFIGGLALGDVGRKVYASDDNTFTLNAGGNSAVGKLVRFEKADYGIVAFDFLNAEEEQPAAAPAATPNNEHEGE